MGKRYFCYSTNTFIIGGAESYGIRLFEEMYKKGFSNILILWEGAHIDSKWDIELKRLHVQVVYISEKHSFNVPRNALGEKLYFEKGSSVVIVAVTPHNYLNAVCFSRRCFGVQFRCIFYQLLQTVFDYSFHDESWRKIFVQIFINKLLVQKNCFMISSDCRDYLRNTYKVDIKGRILPIGLSLSKLDMDVVNKRASMDEFTIISVARMSGDAKFYILGLLDAYASLKKKRKNLKLLLVGDGEHMGMYKAKADSYEENVRKGISFTGNVKYSELRHYMENANVMVGMGTSLLDAAMTGLISIVTRGYGTGVNSQGYFYESGNIGRLVKKNDIDFPMEEAIEKIYMMDSDEYIKNSVASYEMLRNVHDIRKTVHILLRQTSKKQPSITYVLGLGLMEWVGKKYMV